jgi:phosphatidate cytidylyltransferase
MNPLTDPSLRLFLALVGALLSAFSLVGWWLAFRPCQETTRATVRNLNARTRAWWYMVLVFTAALALGKTGMVMLFAAMSFFALREFITLTPTQRGDHRTLFWVFFLITPAQYLFVWFGWYGMVSIFIPVYGLLWLSARSALVGQTTDFLARTAKIQWAVLVCVYFLSHAPALLLLEPAGHEGQGAKLLCFLVCVAQCSDVFQYVWGKTCGRHPVAPGVSPGKTIEGLIGGIATAVALGTGMWWLTPFQPWQAGL